MPFTYCVTLRETAGRIHWTLDVEPDITDGRYEGAMRRDGNWCVKVVDVVTFAGDDGAIGEPDSDSQARSMGDWLYREHGDEIDALVKAQIEKNREYADA